MSDLNKHRPLHNSPQQKKIKTKKKEKKMKKSALTPVASFISPFTFFFGFKNFEPSSLSFYKPCFM